MFAQKTFSKKNGKRERITTFEIRFNLFIYKFRVCTHTVFVKILLNNNDVQDEDDGTRRPSEQCLGTRLTIIFAFVL